MVVGASTSVFTTPRRVTIDRKPALSLNLGAQPDMTEDLGVAMRMRLDAQPLMEIVAMAAGSNDVPVYQSYEANAAMLNIMLQRGTRLRVFEVRKVGMLKRAQIVLAGSMSPVGWMTIWSKDGVHPIVRSVFARPLYEVVSPPLVRKNFETCSREVCLLPVGTKLQVVDSRRNSQGHQRVCIVLLGQDKPLGWITAKKQPGQMSGWVSIREVPADDPLLFSPGASPPGSRPPTSRGRPKESRTLDGWLRGLSASAREKGHASFAQAIAQERAKKNWSVVSPNSSPPRTPTPHRSPVASPREPRPSIFNLEAYMAEREAAAANIEASVQAEGDGEAGKDKGEPAKEKGDGEKQKAQKERAASERKVRRSSADGDSGPLMLSPELEAGIAALQEKIDFEQEKLDPSKKSISVLIGEGVVGSNVKQLVLTWAKRGAEPLNKLEFRQHVRKLLEKPDSKQIDTLFASLDDDGGGTLDIMEISSALKKFQQAAIAMGQFAHEMQARIKRIDEVKTAAQEALDSTSSLEHLNQRVKDMSANPSVASRLGAQILSKRMKASDVINKWDSNGDGSLDKSEFRQNVKGLGVAADSHEIDALFDTLDIHFTGSLDTSQMKTVLTKVIDEATTFDQHMKDLQRAVMEQGKAARVAQVQYKRVKRVYDSVTAKEEEEDNKKAEAEAVVAAEARAVRLAAANERKAEAAKAKAEFEAKVAAKRTAGFM